MSNIRVLRRLGLLSLLCMAGVSPALTIGRHQGVVVLGRPLEIQVPVGLDAGMDPADLCPEAEVSYGDLRVSPRLVDVQVGGGGDAIQVRVRSSQPLDEPFASLQLRIGCSQRLSRKFVLLAEEPASDLPQAVVAPVPVPVPVEAVRSSGVPASVVPSATVAPAPIPAASRARTSSPRVERPLAAAPIASGQAPARPRLKLEALEIRPLAAGSAAGPSPASAPLGAVPARAASDVAASAPAPGEEAARVQALEAEVLKLQDALRRSQAAAADLRARAADIEKERFANPLVYGLLAVAALAMALAVMAWRRAAARRAPAWWQESTAAPAPVSRTAGGSAAEPASEASRAATSSASASAEPLRPSTLIATGRAPGAGSEPMAATSTAAAPASSTSSVDARLPDALSLSTNELSDIQQEADFFVSLGEYDRAIEVLRNHIEIHPQASALAWLDLLEIQHKLGRKDDYEQLRRDFEWLFNARVPAFEAFDVDQNGLEDHPELLARIQALWPDPGVLEVIDAGIFRTPAEAQDKPLGLQAYRDLLFLHQLARDLNANTEVVVPTQVVVMPAPRAAAPGLGADAKASAAAGTRSLGAGLAMTGRTGATAVPAALASPASVQAAGRAGRTLDIDLDEVLAQPSVATDPSRDKAPRDSFAQGLDELLNFDLETGVAEDKPAAAPGKQGAA